jgi:hypothetical protein
MDVRGRWAGGDSEDYSEGERQRQRDQQRRGRSRGPAAPCPPPLTRPVAEAALDQRHAGKTNSEIKMLSTG